MKNYSTLILTLWTINIKLEMRGKALAYSPLGATVSPPSKTKPSSERAKNACSISLPVLRQNYLVAMATSLDDKLENKVQIHHLYVKLFHTVKRLRKSVQYIRRYSTKNASFLAVSYLTFTNEYTVNSEVTGPNFTKYSHDIEASFALLLRSVRPWYCNSFSSISAMNARGISRRW